LLGSPFLRRHHGIDLAATRLTTPILSAGSWFGMACTPLEYNRGLDFTLKVPKIMEAERINALSALLADLTIREAELRRYL
jgi:hypothetical protein